MQALERLRPHALWIMLGSPIAANVVYWFWLARDYPPLALLAFVLCCALALTTGVAAVTVLIDQGLHPVAAVVLALVITPMLIVAGTFATIGGAFFLGGMWDELT